MCYHSDCNATSILKAPFVRGVCQTHFDALKVDLVSRFPQMNKSGQTCHNVALASVLMSDTAAVLSLLGDLDGKINLSGKDCRLSAALEYFETLC